MCAKLFALLALVISVAVAAGAIFLPQEFQVYIGMTMKFVEVLIPVLAVFALLKFVCCCPAKKCD